MTIKITDNATFKAWVEIYSQKTNKRFYEIIRDVAKIVGLSEVTVENWRKDRQILNAKNAKLIQDAIARGEL
jgi:hypothetical protein